jgi:porin
MTYSDLSKHAGFSFVPTALAVVLLLGRAAAAAEDKAGWSTGLDLVADGAAGLSGGIDRGQTLHGLALAKVEWRQAENADRGIRFRTFASVLSLAGRGPTERLIGDFFTASNTEGFASTRLYAWWVEAKAADWSVRAGALLADEEFATTETGGNFLNSAFGWPAFISANTLNTGPAFYVAAPGLRLERSLGETATWRLGLYDGDSFDAPDGDPYRTRHGWHYRVGGAQGWFALTELALAPAGGAQTYKAGAWWHSAGFADVRDDATGRRISDTGNTPRRHAGNFGGYLLTERTLAGKAGEAGHVAAFGRAGFSPVDRNALAWALDTGVAATGLLPGRPADVAALGFTYGRFSPRFAATARALDPGSPAPDFEQVLELNYSVALGGGLTVQPDFQYIRHPGGSASRRDACVMLLRVKTSL